MSPPEISLENVFPNSGKAEDVILIKDSQKVFEKLKKETFKKSLENLETGNFNREVDPKPFLLFFTQLISHKLFYNSTLIKFTIYSPKNQALRTFEKEGQI